MNNKSVLDVLEHSNRPLTSREIELLLRNTKNSRSVFREIKSLVKRDMLIRVEIKLPNCREIVLYMLNQKNTV